MFKTQILADKLTHLTDARYFAARGVDIICFSIPEDQGLDKAVMSINAIKSWIEGPKIYLRPGFRHIQDILLLCTELKPDAIIFPFLSEYNDHDLILCEIYIELIIESKEEITMILDMINKIEPHGILLEIRDKSISAEWLNVLLVSIPSEVSIFIKLAIEPDTPVDLLKLPIKGIAIEGSMEEKLGLKSFDEVDEWLDELEV